MTRSLTGLYPRTALDVSLLTINATPALLLPVSFPEYIIMLPSAVLNLPWPSHQCSAIPITAKPHLSISLSTTVIFPLVIPWTKQIKNITKHNYVLFQCCSDVGETVEAAARAAPTTASRGRLLLLLAPHVYAEPTGGVQLLRPAHTRGQECSLQAVQLRVAQEQQTLSERRTQVGQA